MGREFGKVQPQNSSRHIISNQSSSNSSIGSNRSVKMRKPLLNERWTSILYTLIAALTFATAGTMVGWSSGTFRRSTLPSSQPVPLPLLDNWSISLAATPAIVITVTACVVHCCYRWIGTKAFLLTASLLAIGSSTLDAYGLTFWSASAARILAGISAGIAFTLVPSYVDEFGAASRLSTPNRPPLDGILAAAFPFGVLLRFGADLLPQPIEPTWYAVCWSVLPTLAFTGLLFLPESARYLSVTGRVSQAALILQRTHEPAVQPGLQECLARWQQPGPGLIEAVKRQANLTLLIPLLALFAFQAFVGALPMIFYLTDLLELSGQQYPHRSPEQAAAMLVAIFTVTVAFSRYLNSSLHPRTVLVLSSLLMALAALALGWHCHERRTHNLDPADAYTEWPFVCFALLYIAYALGFHQQPGMLLAAEVTDDNLFALRTVATAICWGSVYLCVRLLPVLLSTIGLGWVLWNVALIALSAAGVVLLCLPGQDEYAHKVLPTVCPNSMTSSVCSSGSSSPNTCWPCTNAPSTTGTGTIAPDMFQYPEKQTVTGPEMV
uniref:Major facilitator superfamily (MFS) profile domain-containing protein n=1 Tax=Anopheles maculatus TaxID=74869 RepID=A0A182S5Q9_9DIPT